MTRLLKPLFHSPSVLAIPVTPPPSVLSHSCSPALLAQRAPTDCLGDQSVPLPGEIDTLQCPSSRPVISHPPRVLDPTCTAPPVCHRSAPPSLNSSPREYTVMPHPLPSSSSSIPSLSSSTHPSYITPLLVDLSEPDREHPQSRLHLLSQAELTPWSHPRLQEPHPDLQQVEWGEHTAKLSFINEGQPSV